MIGVLLLAHGSKQQGTVQAFETISSRVQELINRDGICFQTAFLQFGDIDLIAGLDLLYASGCKEIIVIPYFLFEGNHCVKIRETVKEYGETHTDIRLRCSKTLEEDPLLSLAVAERITALLEDR